MPILNLKGINTESLPQHQTNKTGVMITYLEVLADIIAFWSTQKVANGLNAASPSQMKNHLVKPCCYIIAIWHPIVLIPFHDALKPYALNYMCIVQQFHDRLQNNEVQITLRKDAKRN